MTSEKTHCVICENENAELFDYPEMDDAKEIICSNCGGYIITEDFRTKPDPLRDIKKYTDINSKMIKDVWDKGNIWIISSKGIMVKKRLNTPI